MADLPDLSSLLTPVQLRLAAVILAMSNFIVVLDMTVTNVSIPHIAGSLAVSPGQGSWVITSYSVAEAISVPLTGWLAQRFGAVRLYLVAMFGFGLFSLLCGSSQTLSMIIASRIGQGLCGGLLMPLSQTLLMRIYTGENRPRAMLVSSMTTMLGPAMGPTVGGLINDTFSWHWVFLINLPFVAVCLVAVFSMLYRHDRPGRKVPIDVIGLGLMLLWVGSLQYMLDIGHDRDWFSDPLVVVLAALAVVGFSAFVIWEITEEHPIVDIKVFRHSGFSFGVIALSLCYGGYFASIVVIPQWLQSTMGYPAMWAGFVTSCTALAALSTSWLAVKAVQRGVDPRLLVSLAVAWLGCMSLVRSHWTSGSDFWTLVMPVLLQGLGMSFFMLPLTTITLNSVPPEELASATGMQNFTRTITLGIATALVLTMWSNGQQESRSEIVSRLQPDDAMRTLASNGMSNEQAMRTISSMVDREAVTMAVDHTFLITSVLFFLCAAVIWLAPRPKGYGVPSRAEEFGQTV
jgi:DHA2 family multidrug resistance protein